MKLIHEKKFHIVFTILLSLLVAFALAGRGLFSLPLFYEQASSQRWLTFLLLSLLLFIFVFFATRALILPFLSSYLEPKNMIFLLLLFLILTGTSFISTTHYWANPQKHSVEICFDAVDGKQQLEIQELIEPVTKRQYSPKPFGQDRYPIILKSGTCANGSIVTLYRENHLLLFAPGLTAVVQEPPDGRFFMSINDTPAVIMFDEENNPQEDNLVNFTDGLNKGETLSFARYLSIYSSLKVLALLITTLYLSFFFFGLTEKFITFSA